MLNTPQCDTDTSVKYRTLLINVIFGSLAAVVTEAIVVYLVWFAIPSAGVTLHRYAVETYAEVHVVAQRLVFRIGYVAWRPGQFVPALDAEFVQIGMRTAHLPSAPLQVRRREAHDLM